MPYPTKYTRQYDFQSYQNSNPTRPLPGNQVNIDFNAVKHTTTEIIDFLKTSIRSDGKLANGSVGVNQLDATFKLGFSLPTMWEPNVDYTTDSTVLHDNKFYIANVAHRSTDGFDESKWDLIVDFGEEADSAAASASAASASATAASSSASAAASSATNASDSAVAASNSATAASGSATTATTQAGNASDSATAAATSEANAANSAIAADGSADDAAASAVAAAASAASAGGLLPANNLSDLANASTALTNLGGTTVGKAVFTAADAAAARSSVGLFGIVLAHQYGVKGDGVTDDTAALQAFFDALEAAPYLCGWLIGSSGVFFKTTGTLSAGNNIKVIGTGFNAEIRPTFNGSVMKTKGTSVAAGGGVFLEDFSIVGKSAYVTGISKANPAVVTCAGGHPFVNGEAIRLPNVKGMTQVADTTFTVANATATTFELSGINSSAYSTYTSGGTVVYNISVGLDLRYASNCRPTRIRFQGLQTAIFKYTDSATVGSYYNIARDCWAFNCEVGDQNYTGANSNGNYGFKTNYCDYPVHDSGNANDYHVLAAEVFKTAVTALSGSAGSRFDVRRAENVTLGGTVFSIGSGVTDAIIPARPHLENVSTLLSDSGTRTIFEGVQTISASVTIPVMGTQTGSDQAVAVSGATVDDVFAVTAPSTLPSGMTFCTIASSSQFYIRGIQFAAGSSSAYTATWKIKRHRALT